MASSCISKALARLLAAMRRCTGVFGVARLADDDGGVFGVVRGYMLLVVDVLDLVVLLGVRSVDFFVGEGDV